MNITQQMSLIAKKMGVQFMLNNKPLTPEEVFSETGLLPAFMRRADQLASFCLGSGLNLSFDEFSQGLLGVRVKFDEKIPSTLRIMCATEILQELIDASPNRKQIALDDLMYD